LLTAGALVVGAAIVGLFAWGTYAEHTTLVGQLVPDRGLIKVFAPQPGIVQEKFVNEGASVQQGDALYVITSDRRTSMHEATHEVINYELEQRRASLEAEIESIRALEQADLDSLDHTMGALESEAENLRAILESQQELLELNKLSAARYNELHEEGFVAEEQLISKQEAVLEQRSRLEYLEREQLNVDRQLADLRSRQVTSPIKYQNQRAALERAIAAIIPEATENEAHRRLVIVAPEGGIVTAVLSEVGQSVDSSRPLVSIVPSDAKLEAHLYGASRAVGLVDVGDPVMLRYRAYPYQKFGHQDGFVSAIPRAASPPAELGALVTSDPNGITEQIYRITVDIESQTITAYGEARQLRAGMVVEADLIRQTRRLYEWVLEPLYTLTGKLH
jgi:membrane fusion protein